MHFAGAAEDDIDLVALLVVTNEEVHVGMVEDRPVTELEQDVARLHADRSRERTDVDARHAEAARDARELREGSSRARSRQEAGPQRARRSAWANGCHGAGRDPVTTHVANLDEHDRAVGAVAQYRCRRAHRSDARRREKVKGDVAGRDRRRRA